MQESPGGGTARPSAGARIKGWFITARNRPRKWVVILFSLYAAYCLLFGLILPRALHGVATSALSQSLNADCSLERITYNPFSFTLAVHGLRIPYPDGNGVFLTVESIELAPGFSTFLRMAPALGHLTIVRPAFDVTLHPDGRSSPLQFVTTPKQPANAPEEPSRPFPFILSNLEVVEGSVIFRDEMHGTTHTVEHLTIEVPFASTLQRDSKRPMRPVLNATINGKFMSLEGHTTPFAQTQRSEFRLFIGALPLEYFQPYLTPYTTLMLEKGTITTETVLHFSRTDEALDIGLSGRLELDGIVLAAPGEGPVFSLEHGSVTLEQLLLELEELSIEEILLQNPTITLTKEKNGELNWQRYMHPAPRAAAPVSPKTGAPHANGTLPAASNGTLSAIANGTAPVHVNGTTSVHANGTLPAAANATAPAAVNGTSPPHGNGTPRETANATRNATSGTLPASGNTATAAKNATVPAGNATRHIPGNATVPLGNATQAAAANATLPVDQAAGTPQDKPVWQGLPAVSLKRFSLQNGHVVWLDAGIGGAAPVNIAPLNLEIRDASTEGAGRGAFSLTIGDQTVADPALTEKFFREQAAISQAATAGTTNSTAAANGALPGNGTLSGGPPSGNATLSGNRTIPADGPAGTAEGNATLPAGNATSPSADADALVRAQAIANATMTQVKTTTNATVSRIKATTNATVSLLKSTANATVTQIQTTANATVALAKTTAETARARLQGTDSPGAANAPGSTSAPAMNGTLPGNANGTLPAVNATLPGGTNGTADASGSTPSVHGTIPTANGTMPMGNGTSSAVGGAPGETPPPKRTPSPLGDIALRGTLTLTPLRVPVQAQITALPLALSAPYLKEADFTLSGGHITADTRLLFEQGREGFLFSMAEGNIALRGFAGSAPLPTGSNAVMKVNALSLEKLTYDLAAHAVRIGAITLDTPKIQVTMGGAAPVQKATPAAQKTKAAPVAKAAKAPPPKAKNTKAAPATVKKNGAAQNAATQKNGAPASSAPHPAFSFALDRFQMTKGTVNIINPTAPNSPLSLTGMELVLTDFAAQPGKTVQFSSSATWNGSGKASTTGRGTLTPLNLTLTTVLNNIPLPSVAPWLQQVSILTVASGTFSCDLTTQIADAGIAVMADTTPAQKAKSEAARAKATKDGGAPAPAERPARPEETASSRNTLGVAIAGEAGINNLSLRDGAQEALSLASMRLSGIRVNTQARTYDIGSLALQSPRVTVLLLPIGMNSITKAFDVTGEKAQQARLAQQKKQAQKAKAGGFEQALHEAQSDGQPTPQPTPPPAGAPSKNTRIEPLLPEDITRFTLGTLAIQNGVFRIQDQTLPRKSTVTLSALNFKMTGLSSEVGSKATINLSGSLEGAPLTVSGTASPLFTPFQGALDIKLAGMDMIPLSPYAEKFIAYPIQGGALSLTTTMRTNGTELKSSNEILLGKLTLGDKMNFKGAPNLPVKLGLSLLADNNGLVTLSLPVAGRLDDPNFRLGGIIGKTLTNVLVKVATSPFSLLGAVVGGVTGGGEPALQYVPFAPGDDRVSAAALKTISDVVTLLQKRPKVTLVLQGMVDEGERGKLAEAFIRRGVQQLKWESLSSNEQKTTRPTELQVDPTANAEEYASLLFDFYAAQPFPKPKILGITRKQPVEEMIRLITEAVPTTDVALEDLARKRAEAVRQEILTIAPALADRVSVAPEPKVRESAEGQALMSRVEFGVK